MWPLLAGLQPQLLAACQQGKRIGLVLGLHSLAVCHYWVEAHLRSLSLCSMATMQACMVWLNAFDTNPCQFEWPVPC